MFYFSRDAEAALIELHFLIRYFAESKLFSTTSISSPYGFSSVLCNVGGGGGTAVSREYEDIIQTKDIKHVMARQQKQGKP